METVHFILQGKGGVGKSYIASLLAQYKKNETIKCLDTDPVNQTFYAYKGLDVEQVEILDGTTVNERKFDEMIEKIFAFDGDIIIDNGASSFLPLANYMLENSILDVFKDSNKNVLFHVVITGGQAKDDTIKGLQSLNERFGSHVNYVIWLNEYFGEISIAGKSFEESEPFLNCENQVAGCVLLEKKTSDTFGEDIKLMLEKKLTFDEAFNSNEFSMMAKHRLKKTRENIFTQLDDRI